MTAQLVKESEVNTLKRWLKDIVKDNEYTPDLPELQQKNGHLVFVYGTLKKSKCRGHMLAEADYLGLASTLSTHYLMYNVQGRQQFPVVLSRPGNPKAAPIGGELYEVTAEDMVYLDRIEQNGELYQRRMVPVNFVDSEGQMRQTWAWCYIGVDSFWGPIVQANLKGDPSVFRLNLCSTVPTNIFEENYYEYLGK